MDRKGGRQAGGWDEAETEQAGKESEVGATDGDRDGDRDRDRDGDRDGKKPSLTSVACAMESTLSIIDFKMARSAALLPSWYTGMRAVLMCLDVRPRGAHGFPALPGGTNDIPGARA